MAVVLGVLVVPVGAHSVVLVVVVGIMTPHLSTKLDFSKASECPEQEIDW